MEHQHLLFEWKKWKNVQHKNIRVYSILHFYIFIVFYIQRIIKEMYLQKNTRIQYYVQRGSTVMERRLYKTKLNK